MHLLGNVGLMTFLFNDKKEITDKMENAIHQQFFLFKTERMPVSIVIG